jgi:ketosteroid isomerase-like protein
MPITPSFEEFMLRRREVASAYVNGDAQPLRGISTTADPATFFGPGGGIEQGAARVLEVNEAGARHFHSGADTTLEVLHAASDGTLGYWTGVQRAMVRPQGGGAPVPMVLRVTEVFRCEGDAWKLVHRHADTLAEKQAKR